MRWPAVSIALLITAAASSVITAAILTQDAVPDGRIESLHSEVLSQQRDYVVHLPRDYAEQPQRRYPTIYVLDAGPQFAAMVAADDLLERLDISESAIIVGIAPQDDASRQRDFTPPDMLLDVEQPDAGRGAADRFLGFLQQELIPQIEQQYRSDGVRVLSGHSRGGLFVVYTLLEAPTLFRARFAHSPALWRDDEAMVTRLRSQLATLDCASGFTALTLGDRENDKMRAAYEHAVAAFRAQAPACLAWDAALTPSADHQDNAQLATAPALQQVARWLSSIRSPPVATGR